MKKSIILKMASILLVMFLLLVACQCRNFTNEKKEQTCSLKKETVNKKNKRKARYKTITCKLTAYCPCRQCSGGYGTRTATGTRCKAGRTIAVDRHKIKLGSKVIINNHTYKAEDVGGGVRGNHIDIYFNNHRQTTRFGVKYRRVKVLLN
jgi:3D (Asp-Asp-Asp) domain-containing protein